MKKLIIKGMDKRYFSEKLAEWYHKHRRDLPWRDTTDPYKIWLSEIILQQTRVNQGMPYYLRFVEKYPVIEALARAPEDEVLRLWQGLGYYTRARNLHKCAKAIVQDHKGKFPSTFEELRKLPGIGDYTAAAIASISFKERVAVVDGNVYRVLSRVFGIEAVINSPHGKKQFTALANELIPSLHPDLHNQAVMEFGALFCQPKNPGCEECIFRSTCFAYQNKLQHELPVKQKSRPVRKRYFYYIVIRQQKSLAMKKRMQKDIWHGLFDFYLIEKKRPVKIEKILEEEPVKKLADQVSVTDITKTFKHILTHQSIHARFILVETRKSIKLADKNIKFYSARQIASLPKPILIDRFLQERQLL